MAYTKKLNAVLLSILFLLMVTLIKADDEILFTDTQAIKETNDCIERCRDHHHTHGNLESFEHFIPIVTIEGVERSFRYKDTYCSKMRSAFQQCYKTESATYNWCKGALRQAMGLLTSDPNAIGVFDSCKDKCSSLLENACR